MQAERTFSRYEDIGRFEVPELCALPGTLIDISKEGCKIKYNFPVNVDLENDYDAKITFARSASGHYNLLCHPRWVQHNADSTEIGFQILPSEDFANLSKYITFLEQDEELEPSETDTNQTQIWKMNN